MYLITRHGRATPLWHTVYESTREGKRNGYEGEALECSNASLPDGARATIIAERGFGDKRRYDYLLGLGFDFVARFRQDTLLTEQLGDQRPASQWLHETGRARLPTDMAVTADCYVLPAVVVVHDKRMKDPWCLATNRSDLKASEIVKLYGKRFTIEETFRDTKDIHFDMGLKATHIGDSSRRDRLLLLGVHGARLVDPARRCRRARGMDRMLEVNTSKARQHSLYNQRSFWYDALPNMPHERVATLMTAYDHSRTRALQ